MFRHKGERKVKTIEEDADDITSNTAELLNEEEEELMGNQRKALVTADAPVLMPPPPPPRPGDDKSDEGEEGQHDDSEVKELTPSPREDDNTRDEESAEISFPDTTISLSHLQPN